MGLVVFPDRLETDDGIVITRVGGMFKFDDPTDAERFKIVEAALGPLHGPQRRRITWTQTAHALVISLLQHRTATEAAVRVSAAELASKVGSASPDSLKKTLEQWLDRGVLGKSSWFQHSSKTEIVWEPRTTDLQVRLDISAAEWFARQNEPHLSAQQEKFSKWEKAARDDFKRTLERVNKDLDDGRTLLVDILGTQGNCLSEVVMLAMEFRHCPHRALVRLLVIDLDDRNIGVTPALRATSNVWLVIRRYAPGTICPLHGHIVGTGVVVPSPGGDARASDPAWVRGHYGPRLPDGEYRDGYDVADVTNPDQTRWIEAFSTWFSAIWSQSTTLINLSPTPPWHERDS